MSAPIPCRPTTPTTISTPPDFQRAAPGFAGCSCSNRRDLRSGAPGVTARYAQADDSATLSHTQSCCEDTFLMRCCLRITLPSDQLLRSDVSSVKISTFLPCVFRYPPVYNSRHRPPGPMSFKTPKHAAFRADSAVSLRRTAHRDGSFATIGPHRAAQDVHQDFRKSLPPSLPHHCLAKTSRRRRSQTQTLYE